MGRKGGSRKTNGRASNGHTTGNGVSKQDVSLADTVREMSTDEMRAHVENAVHKGSAVAAAKAEDWMVRLGRAWSQFDRLAASTWLVRTLLVVCVALVYAEVSGGAFVYDDAACLEHGAVTGKLGLSSIFTTDFWGKDLGHVESHRSWRPLTTLVFRIVRGVGNNSPALFHFASLVGYAGVVILVHTLALRFIPDARAAFVAAVIFAVHPAHVEVVANITNLAEVLSGAMFLSAVLLYTRAVVAGRRRDTGYRVALVLGASAMLAKETGVTSLGVMFVYDVLIHLKPLRRAYDDWMAGEAVQQPAAAVSSPPVVANGGGDDEEEEEDEDVVAARAAAEKARAVAAARAQKNRVNNKRIAMRVAHRLGVGGSILGAALAFRFIFLRGSPPAFPRHMNYVSHEPSIFVRALTLMYLPIAHLWTLLTPRNLCHDWSFDSVPLVRSPFDTRFLSALVLYYALFRVGKVAYELLWPRPRNSSAATVGASGSGVRGSGSRKSGSSAKAKTLGLAIGMGLAILIIPFLPASNLFFYVGFIVADRVLFLPSVGYCLLLGTAVAYVNDSTSAEFRDVKRRRRINVLRAVVAAAVVLIACFLASQSFMRTRDWASDLALTESGLAANPGNAKLWYNRGVLRTEGGDAAGAVADYQKATLLWKDYSDPLMALSTYYYQAGQYDKSFKYAQAIARTELPVGDLGKVTMYGAAFTRMADVTKHKGLPADVLYDKALEIFKMDPVALRQVGMAYKGQGDNHNAKRFLQAVMEADPMDKDVADALTQLYVDDDIEVAEQWAMAAYQAGSVASLYNIGRLQQMMHERQINGQPLPSGRTINLSDIESWYRRSIEEFPTTTVAHRWLAHHLQFHAVPKNLTGAVYHYRQFLQEDGSNYRCNVNMGAILLDMGVDLGEAERCFRRALAAEPNSIAAMANLGRVMHKRGRSQEAADYLYGCVEKVDGVVGNLPEAERNSSTPKALHDALAVIWASVGNRARVEHHCKLGACNPDVVLKEHGPAAEQQPAA